MKKRLKILILICVCLLAAACFSGSSRAEVSLGADGKGTLTLVYEKAELDGSLAERNAFENHMNVLVGSVNTASGEKDMVTLKEIKENETSFEVKLAFRRIDGIRGVGDFVWSKFSAAVARESETQFLIDKLSNGNLKCSLERHYDGYVGLVSLDRDAAEDIPDGRGGAKRRHGRFLCCGGCLVGPLIFRGFPPARYGGDFGNADKNCGKVALHIRRLRSRRKHRYR
ncbi:MAG: hypothetical protein ACLUHK_01335 [Eubacteriales bacterium]